MTNKKLQVKELEELFWNNVKHRLSIQDKKANILYHYSGLDSLMGMIETNKIWMSKGTFLNDTNELSYITDILESISEKVRNKVINIYGKNDKTKYITDLFSEEFQRTLKSFQNELNVDDYEVYVFSLTKNSDSLALWYNYAKGDGYNIGFSAEDMLERMTGFSEQVKNQYNFVYGQVVYDKNSQEEILFSFLMDAVHFILKNINNSLSHEELKAVLSEHLFTIITTCSVFFKNEAFKSEEEYRLAFSKKKTTIEDCAIEIYFRSQNGIVIPFIMVDFVKKLPIQEITIGPKNNIDVAKAGMEQYLKSKGYRIEELKIAKSIAELRY